jgi:hypothetical protein
MQKRFAINVFIVPVINAIPVNGVLCEGTVFSNSVRQTMTNYKCIVL